MKLAQIYDHAGFAPYAERAGACATWLQFTVSGNKRTLSGANFCQLRLCPMCTARKAKRNAYKLSQIMDEVERAHDCRYLFLTLTVRNCTGPELSDTFHLLTDGWRRLIKHRKFSRAIGGWFRALEVTRNSKTGEYHPHIHAIIAVPHAYFGKRSDIYITHKEWMEKWKLAIRADYDPSVRISATRARGNCDSASRSASFEAAKYATKDSEYISKKLDIDTAAEIVTTYTNALHRRRLTAFGGWMKEAAKAFDAEDMEQGDLVHLDEDHIREDVAEWIETYSWTVGAGDYILTDRRVNPLMVGAQYKNARLDYQDK